jgi:uncharacterized protein (DUF1330 family)
VLYLVASGITARDLPPSCTLVADGESMSFEEPWSFGAPLLARADDIAALDALKARPGITAFAVEGLEEVGVGRAFGVGAHMMRDTEGFRPYAAAVPDVVRSFRGRFIARGGKVTPVAGTFVPDRVVLIEFPAAEDGAAFYFSDAYAPLLKIRLACTDPRFVLLARSGSLSEGARSAIAAGLRKLG